MGRVLPFLARLKILRGTVFDPFGYTAERRQERMLIRQYVADMTDVLAIVRPDTHDAAIALGALPQDIRGYGPVKAASIEKAAERRVALLKQLHAPPMGKQKSSA